MTDEPTEDATPTVEERLAELETTVAEMRSSVDSALTANDVLQTRYGRLVEKVARLEAAQPVPG